MRVPTSAIGELMTEHRLIMRVIDNMQQHAESIEQGAGLDSAYVDAVLDFLHNYADQNHHGKEEDILFRRLKNMPMTPEHRQMMEDLIEDHRFARRVGAGMAAANGRYRSGESHALADILDAMRTLVDFYPRHIEAEDHGFFKPAIGYFTPEERETLTEDFEEFDRMLVHERYEHLAEELEAGRVPLPTEA
jgi:hemerythrin-like domain-containing protein